MKYKVIRGSVINGTAAEVGQVVELDQPLARYLMHTGKVVPHDESEVVQKQEVSFETREPLVRRGRPAKVK